MGKKGYSGILPDRVGWPGARVAYSQYKAPGVIRSFIAGRDVQGSGCHDTKIRLFILGHEGESYFE
jgi:hypothetical protein